MTQVAGASDLTFGSGQVVPNLVIVGLGPDGMIRLYKNQGTVKLVVDVAGWST